MKRKLISEVLPKISGWFKKHFSKNAGLSKKKLAIHWGALVGCCLLVVISCAVLIKPSNEATASNYTAETVGKQNITVALSSTGTLLPANQYDVTAAVKGEVLAANFEEGDVVTEGQILYEIDKSDMENSVSRASLSVAKSQLSYSQSVESLDNLQLKSDKSGVVVEVYVKVGDQVQNGAKIAEIRDNSYMELKVPFNQADANGFYVGQSATVTMDGSFEKLTGTITAIDGVETVLDGYQIVKNVTIKVSNPGGLNTSSAATATINGAACNQGANFTYLNQSTLTAEVAGKVTAINAKVGSSVANGTVVATLSSTSTQDQVKNSQLSLEDSNLSYQNTLKQLDDYSITAPIAGTVVTKNVKVGDNLDTTNGQSILAVIYDLSYLTFDISLDELDINQVAVNQKVNISCDAIEGGEIEGYVTKVSVAGTTENGVTTYPVTVRIDNPPNGLLPGMNVNATIVVKEASDVLAVPIAALQRGNTIYVQDKSASSDGKSMAGGVLVPDGWKAVTVESGLSNDDYIEIISGLSQGDVVFVPQVVRESSGEQQNGGMPGGDMGGMGGGAPTGGGGSMPSGGAPSGGAPTGGGMPAGGR